MLWPGDTPLPLAAGIEEARVYLRMGAAIDDAVIAGLLRSATALCEEFTGIALVARAAAERRPAKCAWQRLSLTPVHSIDGITGLPADGAGFALGADAFATDIDANGDGWVQVIRPGAAGRIQVAYTAGLSPDAGTVPDPLRQGIIMMCAHLYRLRDGDGGTNPPAAVTALWQPWRRVRLA